MASKHRLKSKIQQAIRKRQASPRPKPIELGDVQFGRWQQITQDYQDVLQDIESTIADSWHVNGEIDDLVIHHALRAALLRSPPAERAVHDIYVRLEMVRSIRDDIEPEDWHDALRVVAESVRTHSMLGAGERNYLAFILPYVAPALAAIDRIEKEVEQLAELEDENGVKEEDYLVIEGRIVRKIEPFDPTRLLAPREPDNNS